MFPGSATLGKRLLVAFRASVDTMQEPLTCFVQRRRPTLHFENNRNEMGMRETRWLEAICDKGNCETRVAILQASPETCDQMAKL